MRKLRNSELNRLSTDEFKRVEKLPIIVALDDVRSMHNVGSVFRTADAFRIEKILLGGITPTPPLPEIEKTALGATDSVDWEFVDDLAARLEVEQKNGFKIVGFEQTSESELLQEQTHDLAPAILVFGNEVKGIRQSVLSVCDKVFEIPQFGTKHSLNISVSAGISIWEFAKPHIKKGRI